MSVRVPFDRAFKTTFELHFASIFRFIDRLSGDEDLAADIAQETFVKLYERGQLPENVRGWLVTVAGNLLRDEWRGSRRRQAILRSQPLAITTATNSGEENVSREETRSAVRAILGNLPMRDRQILLLRHEGYSYREIAGVLEIAEASVGTILLRATAAFAAAIKESGLCI